MHAMFSEMLLLWDVTTQVTPYKPNLSFGQRKKRYKKLLVIENTFISLFILVKFKVVRDFINKSHFQKKIAKKLNGKWF